MSRHTRRVAAAQESLTGEPTKFVDDTESYFAWMRGVAEDKTLSVTARLIGVRLALHRNARTGQCNPSYPQLAGQIGADRVTAIRGVNSMVRRGWLVDTDSRGRRSNNFVLTIPPNSGTSATVDSSTSATVEGPTVAPVSPNSGAGVAQQWHQRHPNDKEGQTNDRAALHAAPCPRVDRVPVTRQERFDSLKRTYKGKIADEAKTLAAFERVLDAGIPWGNVIMAVRDDNRARRPMPDLAEWIEQKFPASPSIQPALQAAE